MKIGTRSLLFGVHQFIWHPFTVVLAWRSLYKRWPHWWELVAIFCHDLGYWGKPNLDGPEGRQHPEGGAALTRRIVFRLALLFGPSKDRDYAHDLADEARGLALGHSRAYMQQFNLEPSPLCWADKFCVFFDPMPLYLLRSWLTGELYEFRGNAHPIIGMPSAPKWFRWYRNRVQTAIEKSCPLYYRDQVFRS